MEGKIINASSIAATRCFPEAGSYSGAKAVLEGASDALCKEVGPLGVRVIVVEPGSFRMDSRGRSLNQPDRAIDASAGTAGARRKENDHTDGTRRGDPARAADVGVGQPHDGSGIRTESATPSDREQTLNTKIRRSTLNLIRD